MQESKREKKKEERDENICCCSDEERKRGNSFANKFFIEFFMFGQDYYFFGLGFVLFVLLD